MAHRLVIDLFYDNIIPMTLRRAEDMKLANDYWIGSVVNYTVICIALIFVLVYIWIFRQMQQDLLCIYEIYNLIDPFFLFSNKYLLNKLKDSFQGIS